MIATFQLIKSKFTKILNIFVTIPLHLNKTENGIFLHRCTDA